MIDWGRVEGFDWDEGNSRKSVDDDLLLVVEDESHSVREMRLHALGRSDTGRLLHVTFTLRRGGTMIRVISARAMHRKERLRYEQEI